MVTKAEWDEMDKRLDAYFRAETKRAEARGQKFERPTCADCRQPVEPWQLRTILGDRVYHVDRCGPDPLAPGNEQ